MRIRTVTVVAALSLVAVCTMHAQPRRAEALARSTVEARSGQRASLDPTHGGPNRVRDRRDYAVLGGFIGLAVGAAYSGARVASGDQRARDHVFAPPLVGVALGAAAGALWYEITRARR